MRGGMGTVLLGAAGLLAGAWLSAAPSAAQAPRDESGLAGAHWQTEDDKFILHVVECGDRAGLCADLVWLLRPLDRDTGQAKLDERNPNLALRDRQVCGLRLVTGLTRETDARWGNASFYNPDDGKTYRANIRRDGDGNLRLRVFLGVEMLGVTMRLRPVPAPAETCAARAEAALADIDNYFAETPGSPWVASN